MKLEDSPSTQGLKQCSTVCLVVLNKKKIKKILQLRNVRLCKSLYFFLRCLWRRPAPGEMANPDSGWKTPAWRKKWMLGSAAQLGLITLPISYKSLCIWWRFTGGKKHMLLHASDVIYDSFPLRWSLIWTSVCPLGDLLCTAHLWHEAKHPGRMCTALKWNRRWKKDICC